MTQDEAQHVRNCAAHLYSLTREAFFGTYYKIFSKTPGQEESFDSYVQSQWEETRLADAFYRLGSSGYKALIESGWNPIKGDDPPPFYPSSEEAPL